jgi:F0F1-type ATP synthase membrane subunit b/b'
MLVNEIVRLEDEAEAVLAQAREEAKRIEQAALDEIEAHRLAVTVETQRRISEFQKHAELENARAVALTQEELQKALDALDGIPEQALRDRAARIVERFKAL